MPGTLVYFDVNGRGEAIRAMLSHAGHQYNDERIGFADFPAIKNSGRFPLCTMPIWEENGFTVSTSNGVLRALGVRLGYYSEDPKTAYAIDSMLDYAEDRMNDFNSYLFPGVLGNPLTDEEGKKWAEETYWRKCIAQVGKRLQSHGKPFVAGTDRPTVADFKLFACPSVSLEMNSATIIPASVQAMCHAEIDKCPEYKQWLERMKTELASHLQSRPGRPG